MRRIFAFCLAMLAAAASAQTRDRTSVTPASAPAAGTEPRHALVIGNSAYTYGALKNPVNDARAMAKALAAAGFKVRTLEDASLVGMQRAVRQWGNDLTPGSVGLFFYAGHGIQLKGRNYLVPVNAEIEQEDEIEFNSLDVNQVLAKMDSAKNALNIVILDACRNNPFARSFRLSANGLAQMDAPTGSFIAFATAPGSTASDSAGSENSVYTRHLARELPNAGVPIEQIFKRVRNGVMADTKGAQVPWESSSLRGEFFFLPPPPAVAMVTVAEMEKVIEAALAKQRALLEARGLKLEAQPPAPDPREKELRAAAEKAAAERAAAERMVAEAKAASEKAEAERLAAQKAVADLAAAEKAAADRTAAAKLAAERATAERVAAEKAAAERAAAEKEKLERLQLATAVTAAVATGAGRLPRQGDSWTYRLTPTRGETSPLGRNHVVRVVAASSSAVLDQVSVDGAEAIEWAHARGPYVVGQGASLFSPYLGAFEPLSPGASFGSVAMQEAACVSPYTCTARARVVGTETVRVPAGRFEAIKVVVEHLWHPFSMVSTLGSAGPDMTGGRTLTVWYAAQVKRAVKYSSRLMAGQYPPMEANFDLELVSYQLK